MKVEKIYISPSHNFKGHHGREPGREVPSSVANAECVAGKGLVGDRFFDEEPNYKGQVTFFSREVHQDLCEEFAVFDKEPYVYRRNVLVSGVNLNEFIGKEFEVQGIQFFGMEEAAPCYWMDQAFCKGAHEALKGYGGLRARILTDGVLKVDEDS